MNATALRQHGAEASILDQIAQQLKDEIASLREYIQRTEERQLVSGWVSELLDPFEQVEEEFSQEELQRVLTSLYQAKYRFSVNGQLSTRVEHILGRYEHLLGDIRQQEESEQLPARDPDFARESEELKADEEEDDFEDFFAGEDATQLLEEVDLLDEDQASPPRDEEEDLGEQASSLFSSEEGEFEEISFADDGADETTALFGEEGDRDAADALFARQDDEVFASEDDESSAPEDNEIFAPETGSAAGKKPQTAPAPKPGNTDPDELFQGADPSAPEKKAARPTARRQKPSRVGARPAQADPEPEGQVDIFSAKISLDELLLSLDIALPSEDKRQMEHHLRNKITSRAMNALRQHPPAEQQYILMPRLTRFVHKGEIYPCTLKNLVRTYSGFFADIKDLMQYRNESFLTNETPEAGWALITPEAPRESLDKSYMEQNQFLRYAATSISVPSHLVRRRTLVEAVYDLIVGRIALSRTLLSKTLDWTATGPTKSDYICVYFADNGIRLRDLPRTTHNRALGCCPNW